jgi:hypothetical protein
MRPLPVCSVIAALSIGHLAGGDGLSIDVFHDFDLVPPQNLVARAIVDVFARRVRLATLMIHLVCAVLATPDRA